MTALRALMTQLIDYAGLFPPAALDMPSAARNYEAYKNGEHAWALGRFIVPATRIGELRQFPESREWKLSVLIGAAAPAPAEADSYELKAARAEDIPGGMAALPRGVPVYFEIPIESDPAPLIEAIAAAGARAKVRTGGATPGAFPSPDCLARFIRACARQKTAFKATAGLHHPIRCSSPLGLMHGFINVFLAAVLAFKGGSIQDLVATLEEQSPAAFRFDNGSVAWHGHSLRTGDISAARSQFAIAFGSCSFTEPIEELGALGWL